MGGPTVSRLPSAPFRRLWYNCRVRVPAVLFVSLLVVGALGGCGVSAARPEPTSSEGLATAQALPPAPLVGRMAPDFTLPRLNGGGDDLSLSNFRGRPVVLNFWATWCGPCRLEMPELEEAYRASGGDLVVVGVQVRDDAGDPAAFLQEVGVTFPVVRDAEGSVQALYLKRVALPTTFFVDRDGLIRYVQVGPMTKTFIEERVREVAG